MQGHDPTRAQRRAAAGAKLFARMRNNLRMVRLAPRRSGGSRHEMARWRFGDESALCGVGRAGRWRRSPGCCRAAIRELGLLHEYASFVRVTCGQCGRDRVRVEGDG